MGVFKAYDVRGICPDQVNEPFATRLGRAIADYLDNQGCVAVGHDHRTTSPGLLEALCAGLHAGGVSTRKLGLVTTPGLWYAVGSQELAGGVMVTASHNPPEYNGFKICRKGVIPVGSISGLAEIQASVEGEAPADVATPGSGQEQDLRGAYVEHVIGHSGDVGSFKVAFDTGNGVVGPTLDLLLEQWSQIEPVRLYFEPDGTFPNHPANPLVPENLEDVCKAVVEHGCALGVAFDGDGDRCVFVDETGEPVPADLMTALLAREVLGQHPGEPIIYDLCSSSVVREEIEAAGGKPVEERVGHAFIKATMRAEQAPFAGENSGHYYWREHWFADSALLTVGRVLALLTKTGAKLSELAAPLKRTFRSGERNFEVEDQDGALEALVGLFPGAEVGRKDGVSVRTDQDGFWFNARKSNTEPLVRVNAEAGTQARLDEGFAVIRGLLGDPVAH